MRKILKTLLILVLVGLILLIFTPFMIRIELYFGAALFLLNTIVLVYALMVKRRIKEPERLGNINKLWSISLISLVVLIIMYYAYAFIVTIRYVIIN
jgi:amino acid transporter